MISLLALLLCCAQAGADFEERKIAVLPDDLSLTSTGIFVGPNGRRVVWMKPTGPKEGVIVLDGVETKPVEGWGGLTVVGESDNAWGLFAWSSDGKRVAWHGKRGSKSILVIDGVEGEAFDHLVNNEVAFSADWTHVAYVAKNAGKSFIILDGKRLGQDYDEVGGPPSLSRDGTVLAYRARRGKRWVGVVNGRELGGEYRDVRAPVISPDGKRVAFVATSAKGTHLVLDGVEGPPCALVSDIRFSPDSRRIASLSMVDGKRLVTVDGKKGEPFDDISAPTLKFSPNSRHVAYFAGSRLVVDEQSQQALRPPNSVPIFSPDGTRLAYAATSPQAGFDIVVDGKVLRGGYEGGFVFSPSGRHFAYFGRGRLMVDRSRGAPIDRVVGLPVFSPDETKVAYPVRKGRDILWKVDAVAPELGPGDPAAIAAFAKVRAVLEKSTSYRLRRACETTAPKPGDPPIRHQDTVLVKGNCLKLTTEPEGREAMSWLVSDGTTLRMMVGAQAQDAPAPDKLRQGLNSAFSHGIPLHLWLTLGVDSPGIYEVKESDGGLSYVMEMGEHGGTARVRIWIDPKTFVLQKRTVELDQGAGIQTLTETFKEYAVDVPIPEGEFDLKK